MKSRVFLCWEVMVKKIADALAVSLDYLPAGSDKATL